MMFLDIVMLCLFSLPVANFSCPVIRKGWWDQDTKEVSLQTLFYNMYVFVGPGLKSW